ncbi:shikimate kinase [Limosilactobacillus mucosae]|uniref:Shikimate kinase n=1 Tax=Limosilactobacillus mucosae TaxID=97478 RepID=A0AAJ1M9T2_LIMMU|nr:shikimate kinase [Limosilactobacillus mucosae]MDC2828058.1 shikimate kinase [Limosilactobacillus mucosae]MDC2835723.1 shikimate kinase [Limosilactobacillus mucosae]
MELILIGFMGSGKTTISRMLGKMLNTSVTDLDDEIVHRAGMTIPDIFAQNGEEYFRQLEHDTLADIIKSDQGILATGGGTPMRPDNLTILKDTSTPVVLLKASATETLRRIGGDSGRPLAKSLDEKGIADLQAQRQVNYDACADLTIKTDGLSPAAIAEEIVSFLNLPISAN